MNIESVIEHRTVIEHRICYLLNDNCKLCKLTRNREEGVKDSSEVQAEEQVNLSLVVNSLRYRT